MTGGSTLDRDDRLFTVFSLSPLIFIHNNRRLSTEKRDACFSIPIGIQNLKPEKNRGNLHGSCNKVLQNIKVESKIRRSVKIVRLRFSPKANYALFAIQAVPHKFCGGLVAPKTKRCETNDFLGGAGVAHLCARSSL